ncbi:NACHT domain-containing protein [Lentzea chajnantorensis]
MARDAVSYRGALKILGKDDPPWLKVLDIVTGGVVLGSGVLSLDGLFAMVDQKNETVRIVREGIGRLTNRISEASGYRRHELVIAAHTTIVLTAFFDAARSTYGTFFARARVTEEEKLAVADSSNNRGLLATLFTAPLPTPSSSVTAGQVEEEVERWAQTVSDQLYEFLAGLSHTAGIRRADLSTATVGNYRSYYLQLQTDVPEFAVWAGQIAHAATHTSLSRLERLLKVGPGAVGRPSTEMIAELNRAELGRPVLDTSTDYGFPLTMPTVDQIFVSPHYVPRGAADEPPSRDLEFMLARHFTTADATTRPLVVLGQPGAGKSLLSRVLAARLSGSGYTVVLVRLRDVRANAAIADQIDQSLRAATHRRVGWPTLTEDAADTIRVVILDGLDELLRASPTDRLDYLHQVAEFQRVEAVLGRPVAVVVTSRTVVADRVEIPEGSPVVTIADFTDAQVRVWLSRWNRVNAGGRPLPFEVVTAQPEISRQPLLLLLLALYYANPSVDHDAELSTTELYERLLTIYADREVGKHGPPPTAAARADDVEAVLRRLSIAALGMVNRGRQSLSEAELTADLAALDEQTGTGRHVFGEFFFIHTSTAREATTVHAYEFLHLTFAEHLAARHIHATLLDLATATFAVRNHVPDDDLLHALLSHQPLSSQAPILFFLDDMLKECPESVRDTLRLLIRDHAYRPPSRRYTTYVTERRNMVRTAAIYSANLLAIYVRTFGPFSVADIWPEQEHGWNDTVALWRAGLTFDELPDLLVEFARAHSTISTSGSGVFDSEFVLSSYVHLLMGDRNTAVEAVLGRAILRGQGVEWWIGFGKNDFFEFIPPLLAATPVTTWDDVRRLLSPELIGDPSFRDTAWIWDLLCTKSGQWPAKTTAALAAIAFRNKAEPQPARIAAAAFRHREVYDRVRDTRNWPDTALRVLQLAKARHEGAEEVQPTIELVHALLDDHPRHPGQRL